MPKSSSKVLFKLDVSSWRPLFIVLGNQIKNNKKKSSRLIIKSIPQKVMAKPTFGHRFHDLKFLDLRLSFYIPWFHYILEGTITKICRKTSILCNFIIFRTNFRQLRVQYIYLHHLLKYEDFSWESICQHQLLGFVDQCVFKCLRFFPSKNSKLVYIFVTSLQPMHAHEVGYLTALAPYS